ncbi:MAG: hypothetical protein M1319_07255 [Chloroflexi bacterium]|nr:hypothetical protein [Chloroflexota bacterium]
MNARPSIRKTILIAALVLGVVALGTYLVPLVAGSLSVSTASAEVLPPEAPAGAELQATATLHTLSIPTASFVPQTKNVDWLNSGNDIKLQSGSGALLAPVSLPQGAIVQKMVVFGYRSSAGGSFSLNFQKMAFSTATVKNLGGALSTDVIGTQKRPVTYSNVTIDNTLNTYYLYLYLNGTSVSVSGVKIIYYY